MNAVVFAERWCFTADTDAARPCSSLRRCDLWRQAAHDDIAMHLDLWAKGSRQPGSGQRRKLIPHLLAHCCSEVACDHPVVIAGTTCVRAVSRSVTRLVVCGCAWLCPGRALVVSRRA